VWPVAPCADTAIFRLVNAVYLKTLPSAILRVSCKSRGNPGSRRVWKHIRAQQSVFESGTATGADRFNLARGGLARYATSLVVSGGGFGATTPVVADLPTSSIVDRRNGAAAAFAATHTTPHVNSGAIRHPVRPRDAGSRRRVRVPQKTTSARGGRPRGRTRWIDPWRFAASSTPTVPVTTNPSSSAARRAIRSSRRIRSAWISSARASASRSPSPSDGRRTRSGKGVLSGSTRNQRGSVGIEGAISRVFERCNIVSECDLVDAARKLNAFEPPPSVTSSAAGGRPEGCATKTSHRPPVQIAMGLPRRSRALSAIAPRATAEAAKSGTIWAQSGPIAVPA
jgi:hypothetical protein